MSEIDIASMSGSPSNSVLNRLASGAFVALMGRILGRALSLVGQIALARLLGPELFGLYAVSWTMLQMAGTVAPLGLDKGVIRYGSMLIKDAPSHLLAMLLRAILVALVSGAILAVLVLLLSPLLTNQAFDEPDLLQYLRMISPAIVFLAGLKVAAAATRVSQKMVWSVLVEDMLPPAALLLLFIVFYMLGWGLKGAIGAVVISYSVSFVLALPYILKNFRAPRSSRNHIELDRYAVLRFSISASLAGIFSLFIIWANRLVLGLYRPESEVGIFQVATQLPLLSAVIMSAFNAIITPIVADLHHKQELESLREVYLISTKWSVYLGVPLFVVLLSAPRELLTVLYGASYASGSRALMLFCVGQLFNLGSGAVGLVLQMMGRQTRWMKTTFTFLVLSLMLNILLAPDWGLEGTAVATSVGIGGLYLFGLGLIKRELGALPYDKRFLKIMISGSLALFLGLWMRSMLETGPLNLVIVISALTLSFYLILLILLGFDPEDRLMFEFLKQRIFDKGTGV